MNKFIILIPILFLSSNVLGKEGAWRDMSACFTLGNIFGLSQSMLDEYGLATATLYLVDGLPEKDFPENSGYERGVITGMILGMTTVMNQGEKKVTKKQVARSVYDNMCVNKFTEASELNHK